MAASHIPITSTVSHLRQSRGSSDCTKKGLAKIANPLIFGGAERDRTDDLLNAIQALSQLSYSPIQELFL